MLLLTQFNHLVTLQQPMLLYIILTLPRVSHIITSYGAVCYPDLTLG